MKSIPGSHVAESGKKENEAVRLQIRKMPEQTSDIVNQNECDENHQAAAKNDIIAIRALLAERDGGQRCNRRDDDDGVDRLDGGYGLRRGAARGAHASARGDRRSMSKCTTACLSEKAEINDGE